MSNPKALMALLFEHQAKFTKTMHSAQSQALQLAQYLDLNLNDILTESLALSGQGKSLAIGAIKEFSKILGDSLPLITQFNQGLTQVSAQLKSIASKKAEAREYLVKEIGPKIQKTGQSLTVMGKTMVSFSENLGPGQFKDCVTSFGSLLQTLGAAANGIVKVLEFTAKLDTTVLAPTIETLNSSIHRTVENLHSTTESIREFCQGIHLTCETLSKKGDIKTNSTASKQLDRVASMIARKASTLLWSLVTGPTPNSTDIPAPTKASGQNKNKA